MESVQVTARSGLPARRGGPPVRRGEGCSAGQNPNGKRPAALPEYLEAHEVEGLMRLAPHGDARLLMLIQWRAGLRISEALALEARDVQLDGARPTLRVRRGMEMSVPLRGDVYLVSLDPARGEEIKRTRPCVIVSPDELNRHVSTFLIAPMTTGGHPYPFRISCSFNGQDGYIVLDQLRAVDRRRLIRQLGRLTAPTLSKSLDALQRMFAE